MEGRPDDSLLAAAVWRADRLEAKRFTVVIVWFTFRWLSEGSIRRPIGKQIDVRISLVQDLGRVEVRDVLLGRA